MLTPDWQDDGYNVRLYLGDCEAVLSALPDASIDSIVTDPPYGLSFMGKRWDHGVPGVEVWRECLRVLKPGGYVLAFGGTRTEHRQVVAIEDAGFEIRDKIAWVYGSGFPKSHDISKAIDKAAGAEREVVSEGATIKRMIPGADQDKTGSWIKDNGREFTPTETTPATPDAERWSGWGTALKPAFEPICMARKPFRGTVAANVLEHGTGAINVDGCRVGTEEELGRISRAGPYVSERTSSQSTTPAQDSRGMIDGRWPSNFIHDGSPEVVGLMPDEDGISAARYFYCPKASKQHRDEGLESGIVAAGERAGGREEGSAGLAHPRAGTRTPARNPHPTVKPVDLMQYLCRLVTPPGGIVLDPFMGSGSTGKAARREGFGFVGIELERESFDIAVARVGHECVTERGGALFAEATEPCQPTLS